MGNKVRCQHLVPKEYSTKTCTICAVCFPVEQVYRASLIFWMKCKNLNVPVYSPEIPVSLADCTVYNAGIGTRPHSLIFFSEEIHHFAHSVAATDLTNYYNATFFVPPGTHHC